MRAIGRILFLPAKQTFVGLALLAALVSMGCAGSGPDVNLKSDDPAGRIPAMKLAAKRHDEKAVPDLIASLSSDDPAERFYAIESLRRITNQSFGYVYFEDEKSREKAVERWKSWLEKQKQ